MMDYLVAWISLESEKQAGPFISIKTNQRFVCKLVLLRAGGLHIVPDNFSLHLLDGLTTTIRKDKS